MQMNLPPARGSKTSACFERYRGNLGKVFVLIIKSVLETPAVLENVQGKSSAILVCLSESCLSHDITSALCYKICHTWLIIQK